MKKLAILLALFAFPAWGQQISPPPSLPLSGGSMTGIYSESANVNQTATGTTLGGALGITTQVIHLLTVPASSGVRLPASMPAGTTILVINRGANTLNVYPPSGGSIDGGAINAAVTLATNTSSRYTTINGFVWFSN